jgi:hypothetical protein
VTRAQSRCTIYAVESASDLRLPGRGFHLTEVSVSFAAGNQGDLFVFNFGCRGERYDNWL